MSSRSSLIVMSMPTAGMARLEARNRRRQLVHAEGRAAMQAQLAARAGTGFRHFGLGLVHRRQDGPRPAVEGLALGRQLQAARGPLQQPGAEPIFQPGHQFRQRGRGQTQIPRRSREPPGFHGTNKGSHLTGTIHGAIMEYFSSML
jgi:hypothetical protein